MIYQAINECEASKPSESEVRDETQTLVSCRLLRDKRELLVGHLYPAPRILGHKNVGRTTKLRNQVVGVVNSHGAALGLVVVPLVACEMPY